MIGRIWIGLALLGAAPVAAEKSVPDVPATTADAIAYAGHGMIFDSKMRRIASDPKSLAKLQASLDATVVKARLRPSPKATDFIKRLDVEIAAAKTPEYRTLLTSARIARRLEGADARTRARYAWRNRTLAELSRANFDRLSSGRFVISAEVLRRLIDSGLIIAALSTQYMDDCRAQQVPVPPNFRMTGTTWVNQGNLSTNLLSPGGVATVFTWTDPARRGACVALPRDNGGPGSVAGIICQSAVTGRACFWDNMVRGNSARIPAATATLVIRDIQDGRTLDVGAPCTACHAGNNVFLMSPDDPTWRKLMRGPLDGPRPGTFTTIVEPQTDSPGGPRYTPIAHASWTNPALASGCSGVCHGRVSASMMNKWSMHPSPPAMPPACATAGNYRNCYGTP